VAENLKWKLNGMI